MRALQPAALLELHSFLGFCVCWQCPHNVLQCVGTCFWSDAYHGPRLPTLGVGTLRAYVRRHACAHAMTDIFSK